MTSTRFSSPIGWLAGGVSCVVVAFLALMLLTHGHLTWDVGFNREVALFSGCYRQMRQALGSPKETGQLSFPECIRRWNFYPQLTTLAEARQVSDLKSTPPDTVLLESKRKVKGQKLLLLADGSIWKLDRSGVKTRVQTDWP